MRIIYIREEDVNTSGRERASARALHSAAADITDVNYSAA